jgi:hypothetical protein
MRVALRRFGRCFQRGKTPMRSATLTATLFFAALGIILYAPSGELARPLALVALTAALVGFGFSIFGKLRRSKY